MKVLGSRLSFYAGFVVGTVTLYVFLRFEKCLFPRRLLSLDRQRQQQQLEEDEKVWKKDRSALFNLKHPHHTGVSRCVPESWSKLVVAGPLRLPSGAFRGGRLLISF